MNRDPLVMEFLGPPLSDEKSNNVVDSFLSEFAARGFCPWAVEIRSSGEFAGFVGLHAVPITLPFAPAVEVGWRLDPAHWGRGVATEAAEVALRVGFTEFELDEIVSMTAVINKRSQRVMERLGLHRSEHDDFDHPSVDESSPLRAHVLYRLSADAWRRRRAKVI
jgi:RimJ/RimL family protein N-acetyltransferase